jgi:hypothetical protein
LVFCYPSVRFPVTKANFSAFLQFQSFYSKIFRFCICQKSATLKSKQQRVNLFLLFHVVIFTSCRSNNSNKYSHENREHGNGLECSVEHVRVLEIANLKHDKRKRLSVESTAAYSQGVAYHRAVTWGVSLKAFEFQGYTGRTFGGLVSVDCGPDCGPGYVIHALRHGSNAADLLHAEAAALFVCLLSCSKSSSIRTLCSNHLEFSAWHSVSTSVSCS